MLFQEASGDKFAQENEARIDAAPQKRILTPKQPADRGQQAGSPIDGEHPDRGASYQGEFFLLKGVEGRK